MYNLILSSVLIILLLILIMFILRLLLKKSFHHAHVYQNLEPKDFDLSSEELFIQTTNKKKVQVYRLGDQNKGPMVLCIHGWENTVEKFLPLSQQFVQRGYRVVLLNTRNHGKSDADGYSSMVQFAEDLKSTITYCRSIYGEDTSIFLLGHSLGAATVLYHASKDSKLAGVISLASFAELKKVIKESFLSKHMPRMIIPLILKFMELSVGDRFENLSPIFTIGRINIPVLLLHGDHDKIIHVSELQKIHSASSSEKILTKTIAGADHSSILDYPETAETILAFLSR